MPNDELGCAKTGQVNAEQRWLDTGQGNTEQRLPDTGQGNAEQRTEAAGHWTRECGTENRGGRTGSRDWTVAKATSLVVWISQQPMLLSMIRQKEVIL